MILEMYYAVLMAEGFFLCVCLFVKLTQGFIVHLLAGLT